MSQRIKKAVIAVAGFGTRFLPATKAQPKEMLTLIDKPVIQYIVEELVESGIEMIVFVTSQNKRAIEDHFDRNFELEYILQKKGKKEELKIVKKITDLAEFVYIRQKSPRGWGDAILAAEKVIGNDPFVYTSGDDIFLSKRPAIKQLLDVYDRYQDGVVGVIPVPHNETHRYGIIGGTQVSKNVYEMNEIIEKPKKNPPSNLAVIGRYVFMPEIFAALKKTPLNDGELVGTDAMKRLIKKGRPYYAREIEGTYYDCGNKLGYIQATVDFALHSKEFKGEFKKFLRERI